MKGWRFVNIKKNSSIAAIAIAEQQSKDCQGNLIFVSVKLFSMINNLQFHILFQYSNELKERRQRKISETFINLTLI